MPITCIFERSVGVYGFGVFIVGKADVGADEYAVFYRYTLRDKDKRLNFAVFSDHGMIFYLDKRADFGVVADGTLL